MKWLELLALLKWLDEMKGDQAIDNQVLIGKLKRRLWEELKYE